uniref:RPGRIP1 C-terminal domain-containing protein n=2 Tax=Graphocephala atropunctata TaxID=36148 RepID=A0A1B6KWT7_9HEMI
MRFNHTKRLKVDDSNAKRLQPMLKPHHAKALRFLVLSEPCSLTQGTEIEEIGYAELNLMEEMVQKNQDVISTELPVYDTQNQLMGTLSVTVIGNSTLQSYMDKQSLQS